MSLEEVLPDSDELPPGCVPYMPSPVDVLTRIVEHAPVTAHDVFVDVGCGVGRAALFLRLLSGARSIGVDIQSRLVNAARANVSRLGLDGVEFLVADACDHVPAGSVYFLYCPFGAERVRAFLDRLRVLGTQQSVTLACLDMQLPACDWLVQSQSWADLRLYRSVKP